MLIEFSVENYRSFRTRQTLSMVASSDKTLRASHTVPMPGSQGRLRVLPSVVIYGPNAAGKSNLVKAMRLVALLVTRSAKEMQADEEIQVKPFALDAKTSKQPSRFEIMFIQEGVRYQYGMAVDARRVYEEWLAAYPKGKRQLWYERHFKPAKQQYAWQMGPGLKGERGRIKEFVRPNSFYLSHAAQNNHPQLSTVFNWFASFVNLDPESTSEAGGTTAALCSSNKKFRQDVVNFLKVADVGVEDLLIKPVDESWLNKLPEEFREDTKNRILFSTIKTFHKSSTGKELIPLDLKEESDGTLRLFEFAGPWLDALQKGKVLCIDELDTSLHARLTQHLVHLFNDPRFNKGHAQLVATTHDISLLDQKLLRRDQIWLMEKDSSGSSHLYPLTDYSPRKDEALQKGYLYGRYGAVPFVETPIS